MTYAWWGHVYVHRNFLAMSTIETSVAEGRTANRQSCSLPIAWRVLGNRHRGFQAATLQDIGTDGLSLEVDQLCSTGSVVIIQFAGATGHLAEPMLLQAQWCKELPATANGKPAYRVGCGFVSPLSDQDLQTVLALPQTTAATPEPPKENRVKARRPKDPWLLGSRSEKRAAVRRGGASVRVTLYCSERDHRVEASVVDRSLKGLGILANQPFTRGTLLMVRPHDARGSDCSVAVEVRNCRQKGKEWIIGCRFLRTPSSNILMLLG